MRYRLLILALFAACANVEDEAKQEFSEDFSCPTERVTTKLRADLKAFEFQYGPQQKPEPPPEIKSDPARLAVWEEQQKKDQAATDRVNEIDKVIEVTGCDQSAFYICYINKKNKASCSTARPFGESGSKPAAK